MILLRPLATPMGAMARGRLRKAQIVPPLVASSAR